MLESETNSFLLCVAFVVGVVAAVAMERFGALCGERRLGYTGGQIRCPKKGLVLVPQSGPF